MTDRHGCVRRGTAEVTEAFAPKWSGAGPLTYKELTRRGSTKKKEGNVRTTYAKGPERRGRNQILYGLKRREERGMLISSDTYISKFRNKFTQEKGNTGGSRCPVPHGPGRRFKSNKLCASDITYLKRLAKGARARRVPVPSQLREGRNAAKLPC